MLYSFKARFQKLAEKLAFSGMTANHASFLGIVFVAMTMLVFFFGLKNEAPSLWLVFVPLFIFFRLIMNALDGMLARAQKTASASGEILNELSDVVGDTCSYGILYFLVPTLQLWIFIFIVCIWFCEFVAVLGQALPNGRRRQESLGGGKPERAVWISIIALAIYFVPSILSSLGEVFIALSFLVLATGILRIQKSLKDAQGKPYESRTQFGK
jgi:phosphatidylglycerophosphate synthase